jgi:hypothetical protein
LNKPKPEIVKIEFPKEDQEYIDAMLEGKPTPNVIKQWTKRGEDIKRKDKMVYFATTKGENENNNT